MAKHHGPRPKKSPAPPQAKRSTPRAPRKDPVLAALAALALVLFAAWAYAPVLQAQFINFDDTDYVTANEQVRAGLSAAGTLWAFTATHASNWHPLTWLSHMLDVQLFGLDAAAHHRTNLVLHLANTVLLLLALRRLTGRFWPSLAVAGLFALHPLHVESVAWVAERKDVLSSFFFFLALYLYAGYGRTPSAGRYIALCGATALGLMAKPMLVTLPCVLLLLDYWPLERLAHNAPEKQGAPGKLTRRRLSFLRLAAEKLPLLALAGLAAFMVIAASRQAGAMASLDELGMTARIANAVAAYLDYLIKLVAPTGLAVYYPLRTTPAWEAAVAAFLLLAISTAAFTLRRKAPYLLVGWLWFLGMLVPVVGLVQVGGQAMADRYTYLPALGLFLALVWGAADLAAQRKAYKIAAALAGLVTFVALGLATRGQAAFWKNSETLYTRALSVTAKNFIVQYNLGSYLSSQGREPEALAQYEACLAINPNYAKALNNAAWLLATSPDSGLRDAGRSLELALKGLSLAGPNPAMLDTLAAAYAANSRYEDAAATARQAQDRARAAGNAALAADIGTRLERFERGMPYRR